MHISDLIAARPAERGQLSAWYSAVLDAAQQEGLAVPALATRLGVSNETVYAWRRRLRSTAASRETATQVPSLVRVQIATSSTAASSTDTRLTVQLERGRQVLVPTGFDPDSLAALVATLERC